MKFKAAEVVTDSMTICTEFFIDTPDGRMSVRMPNFVSYAEQQHRIKVMVGALNEQS
jgi:hypothetical protein